MLVYRRVLGTHCLYYPLDRWRGHMQVGIELYSWIEVIYPTSIGIHTLR